jgi:HEAT repeat protein
VSLLPPLPPNFEAALRDVTAKGGQFRFAAAKALGDAPVGREDEARRGLATLARDTDPRIRAEALRSAARIPHPDLLPLVDEAIGTFHPLVIDPALELAASLGPEGHARITQALASPRADVRFAAARAIILAPFEGAAAALLSAFPDEDEETSAQIARALGDLGVQEARDPLARALESKSTLLKTATAFALGDLGDDRAVPPLLEALGRRATMADAAVLLAKLQHGAAVPALEREANRLLVPAFERAMLLGALVRLGGASDADSRLGKMLASFFPTKRAVAAHAVVVLELRSMLPLVRDAVRRGRLPRSLGDAIEAALDDRSPG